MIRSSVFFLLLGCSTLGLELPETRPTITPGRSYHSPTKYLSYVSVPESFSTLRGLETPLEWFTLCPSFRIEKCNSVCYLGNVGTCVQQSLLMDSVSSAVKAQIVNGCSRFPLCVGMRTDGWPWDCICDTEIFSTVPTITELPTKLSIECRSIGCIATL